MTGGFFSTGSGTTASGGTSSSSATKPKRKAAKAARKKAGKAMVVRKTAKPTGEARIDNLVQTLNAHFGINLEPPGR